MALSETPHPVPKHVRKTLKKWGLQTLALGESSTVIGACIKGDESAHGSFKARICHDEVKIIIKFKDIDSIAEIWLDYLDDVFVEHQKNLIKDDLQRQRHEHERMPNWR